MNKDILKLFGLWNNKKQSLHNKDNILKFREKDIFFMAVGLNIGYEQYGKGDDFLRPVLVYKKFNSRTLRC